MQPPAITIVIPVYNRAHIVTRTLDSVYGQTFRPISLIVVDNNSTDGSLEVITQWADTHRHEGFDITILQESAPGAPAARNRGLDAVTTPYTMFFDSDDTMGPSHVEKVMEAFARHPDADIAGYDIRHHFANGATRILTFNKSLYSNIFHASLATQRYTARTDLFLAAGRWDEEMKGWDDYELGMRLLTLRRKPCIIKLKGITVDTYQQTESITGTDFSSRPEVWEKALDRCGETLAATGHWRELRYIERRRVILAAHYRRENSPHAKRLLGEVMSREKNPWRRMFYQMAYRYTAAGGRGISIAAKFLL